jgi:hypothetical protein
MTTRSEFESWYAELHAQFVAHPAYAALVRHEAGRDAALHLVRLVCRTHLRSPQILGFLYAIVPPRSRESLEHNLLEELGREHESEPSHPELLRRLGMAVGLDAAQWRALEEGAEQVLRNKATEPLMFGTLVEIGFAVMLEVFAFEWMLARESRRIGDALRHQLGLSAQDLDWFYHHSEVDIGHAEQGLDALVDYTTHYRLDPETVRTIAEITFRENIFLKRYFDLQVEAALGGAGAS